MDRYEVRRLLGRGGMGVVYLVEHLELGSRHALKVIADGGGPAGARLERMVREGRLQASLSHPNVLPVTDLVRVGPGVGLITPFIEGPSLADLIARGPLPLDVLDAIGAGLLTGAAEAHAAGLVHRDLKPGNVLLAPDGDGWRPVICDFGLARALDDGGPRLTATGATMGTPAYMAPEQFGDAKSADARADVWSLGAILLEMATGAPPFSGPDVWSIHARVVNGPIPSPAALRADLPARMAATVTAALVRPIEARPPDASALLARWTDRPARPRAARPVPTPAPPPLAPTWSGPPESLDLPGGTFGPPPTASMIGTDMRVAPRSGARALGWGFAVVGVAAGALIAGAVAVAVGFALTRPDAAEPVRLAAPPSVETRRTEPPEQPEAYAAPAAQPASNARPSSLQRASSGTVSAPVPLPAADAPPLPAIAAASLADTPSAQVVHVAGASSVTATRDGQEVALPATLAPGRWTLRLPGDKVAGTLDLQAGDAVDVRCDLAMEKCRATQ